MPAYNIKPKEYDANQGPLRFPLDTKTIVLQMFIDIFYCVIAILRANAHHGRYLHSTKCKMNEFIRYLSF